MSRGNLLALMRTCLEPRYQRALDAAHQCDVLGSFKGYGIIVRLVNVATGTRVITYLCMRDGVDYSTGQHDLRCQRPEWDWFTPDFITDLDTRTLRRLTRSNLWQELEPST